MVAIERLNLGRERDVAFPGRWHQDAQRVEHVASVALEQVQRLVETCRVGPLVPDDRPHFGRQGRLARLHPCAVAEQRIDLAVMRQEAERLRQLPGRECIGRVALVENCEAALVIGVTQVGVERRQLMRGEQPFVDQCPG